MWQRPAPIRPRIMALVHHFISSAASGGTYLMPVVEESNFWQHYASLWNPPRQSRKSSPLTDILLAVCLQYGYGFIPQQVSRCTVDNGGASAGERLLADATTAGRNPFSALTLKALQLQVCNASSLALRWLETRNSPPTNEMDRHAMAGV